jgi:hypothetical protein
VIFCNNLRRQVIITEANCLLRSISRSNLASLIGTRVFSCSESWGILADNITFESSIMPLVGVDALELAIHRRIPGSSD